MNRLRHPALPSVVVATACLLLFAPTQGATPLENSLTPEQIAAGWISLFDGESLHGWEKTSDADWRVENGEIRVGKGEPGWLMTTSEFADYDLHVEFKAPATTNSGVFLRTPLAPQDPTKDCVEVNIAPRDNPYPTGSLVGRSKLDWSGMLYRHDAADLNDSPRRMTPAETPDPWDGQWHAIDVRVDGSAGGVLVDRVMTAFDLFRDPTILSAADPRRGRVGLQFREGEVAFRNIRLRPLGLKSMLNGRDLAGWNTAMTRESKFEVKQSSGSLPLVGRAGEGGDAGTRSGHPSLTLPVEGRGPEREVSASGFAELHVTSGPGLLETESSYGDFVMQLECYVDGDGLNSGVFFRSIPRDYANGYESQIQNGVKQGDPTKPVDAGTGAIYRRTTVARVVSRDREWFAKTIVATGPHLAVWVNGRQVTDWTDERPPHANPRNGRRVEAGTISLQGHDPTTNLRFRLLRIAELPAAEEEGAE